MLYRIADLTVEIPTTGGMAPRCKDYIENNLSEPDIVILEELYNFTLHPEVPKEIAVYMQSGIQFYRALLAKSGMMLHSSAVEYNGRAYLFSGPSRVGKSTHTRLWTELFDGARIINDDKPALRLVDGVWYAYGTPWSGKHSINLNVKVPLAGICFLEQGNRNEISHLNGIEAVVNIIGQTTRKKLTRQQMDCLLNTVQLLSASIPIYKLLCLPEAAAAQLSCSTMSSVEGGKESEN